MAGLAMARVRDLRFPAEPGRQRKDQEARDRVRENLEAYRRYRAERDGSLPPPDFDPQAEDDN